MSCKIYYFSKLNTPKQKWYKFSKLYYLNSFSKPILDKMTENEIVLMDEVNQLNNF